MFHANSIVEITTTSPLQAFTNSEKRLFKRSQIHMSLEALDRKRSLKRLCWFFFSLGKEKESFIFPFQTPELYFKTPGKSD